MNASSRPSSLSVFQLVLLLLFAGGLFWLATRSGVPEHPVMPGVAEAPPPVRPAPPVEEVQPAAPVEVAPEAPAASSEGAGDWN